MTEMPVDVIMSHLVNDLSQKLSNYQLATNIDLELQRKFYFIPKEEVNAVEIIKWRGEEGYQAGSGPETIRAMNEDNPAWLYNSAVNALAMMQHLQKIQQFDKRPEPGVYQATQYGVSYFTVLVTEDRRVLVPQSDGGADDYTSDWDSRVGTDKGWTLTKFDLTTGKVSE